jgi:hypothetical protein
MLLKHLPWHYVGFSNIFSLLVTVSLTFFLLAVEIDNQQPGMLLAENEQIDIFAADKRHEADNDDNDMGSCINCAPCTAELDLTGEATDRMVDVGEGGFFSSLHFPLSDDNNLESALQCDNIPTVATSSTTPASNSAGFQARPASLDSEIGQ